MIIYDDGITFVMTLLVAVHNGTDFVVGSDKLVKRILPDGKISYETHPKIFLLNPSTALMTSGAYDNAMRQFIADYINNNQGSTDLDSLRAGMLGQSTLPKLGEDHFANICFVGFTNDEPDMKRVLLQRGKEPLLEELNGNNIFAAGLGGPENRARELIRQSANKLDGPADTATVRKIVKSTLLKCIREYKNNNDEQLGGPVDIYILRK